MTVGVRAFTPEDATAVRTIQEASLATDAIPGFVPDDIERAMLRIVADPGGTVVATEDGVVVGYATPHHDDLAVLPSARRRGHGRRLVEAAHDLVGARGYDELVLYVPPHLPGSVAFAEAADIVHKRCTQCHSSTPTDDTYKVAPNGVMFDTPEQIQAKSAQIVERAVTLRNMPLANITKMTPEERETLRAWVDQGAKGP